MWIQLAKIHHCLKHFSGNPSTGKSLNSDFAPRVGEPAPCMRAPGIGALAPWLGELLFTLSAGILGRSTFTTASSTFYQATLREAKLCHLTLTPGSVSWLPACMLLGSVRLFPGSVSLCSPCPVACSSDLPESLRNHTSTSLLLSALRHSAHATLRMLSTMPQANG